MTARSVLVRIAVIVLFAAALSTVPVAFAIDWVACENQGTPACERKDLAQAQFYVAIAGVVPALLLVVDTWRGRRRAVAWFAFGLAVYVAWGLLADAAVHGWDDLLLVPGS